MPDRRSKYIPTEIKNKLMIVQEVCVNVAALAATIFQASAASLWRLVSIRAFLDVAVPANASESDYEIVGVPMCPDCIQLHILSSDNESPGGQLTAPHCPPARTAPTRLDARSARLWR